MLKKVAKLFNSISDIGSEFHSWILNSLLLITRQPAQLICLGCKIIQSAEQLQNYS